MMAIKVCDAAHRVPSVARPALHGAVSSSIPLLKGKDGVDLVDVIAQPVEKRIAGQSAKVGLGCNVAKDGVEAARDIRGVREACATLCGVDAAILTRPLIDILEKMLV